MIVIVFVGMRMVVPLGILRETTHEVFPTPALINWAWSFLRLQYIKWCGRMSIGFEES